MTRNRFTLLFALAAAAVAVAATAFPTRAAAEEGKKKIVFVHGKASHGYGGHAYGPAEGGGSASPACTPTGPGPRTATASRS